ncbi:MAG: hypothetical protein KJZ74_03595 [Gemmatimonadales bacterium]|nr:hypothetical protein [Gemmatimonadota bacterium]MCL4212978.1 hypothetical protein [Gemmatimonadales bacterium]
MPSRPRIHAAAFLLTLLAACADSGVEPPAGPTPTVGDSSAVVNFLRPAVGAPAIANPVVSFYAKVGEDREAFMYYQRRASGSDSTVFVRFRVRPNSLLSRPGGAPFVAGDSILITITLVDPSRLQVSFSPSGLRFSPSDPADLKLSFLEADEDLNGDGVVDSRDTAIQAMLAVWRRERVGDPWVRQPTILAPGTHEVETDILGFTDYVIAW